MFTEFLDPLQINPPIFCSSINSTDQISAKVINEGFNSTKTGTFDLLTVDASNNKMCYSKETAPSPLFDVATLAPFINELPCMNNCGFNNPVLFHLPQFGTDTIQGYVYYNSALNSISVPYNAGYYNEIKMWNP